MNDLDKFQYFLQTEKGQKERTLKNSNKVIKKVLADAVPLNADTFKIVISDLISRKAAPSYIKQHISLIHHWGECFDIPELFNFKSPKIWHKSDFERATFSDDEIYRFLSLPNPFNKEHKRLGTFKKRYEMWIMFYSILFYHGMRTLEIAQLEVDMIDFGLGVINLPSRITKTSNARSIPISPSIRKNLEQYINNLDQKYLFPALRKSDKYPHVTQGGWSNFFNKQIKRLGIKRKNLTPYSGRHSYGTRQAEEGVSVFKIKATVLGEKQSESLRQSSDKMGTYKSILEQREQNAQEDKVRAIVASSGVSSYYGDKFFYYHDGKVKSVDTSFEPKPPKLTGEAELDKNLMSKYRGELTRKKNDIIELFTEGAISETEAEKQLGSLKTLSAKTSTAKGKKAKKGRKVAIKIAKVKGTKKNTITISKAKKPKPIKIVGKLKKPPTLKSIKISNNLAKLANEKPIKIAYKKPSGSKYKLFNGNIYG